MVLFRNTFKGELPAVEYPKIWVSEAISGDQMGRVSRRGEKDPLLILIITALHDAQPHLLCARVWLGILVQSTHQGVIVRHSHHVITTQR